jgi:hypothetical protein
MPQNDGSAEELLHFHAFQANIANNATNTNSINLPLLNLDPTIMFATCRQQTNPSGSSGAYDSHTADEQRS